MSADAVPNGASAVCRHCGKPITRGTYAWIDTDGLVVCVKPPTPSVRDAVLHQPMPDGLSGAVSSSILDGP